MDTGGAGRYDSRMDFQRARTEEQRAQRRRAILDATAAMLAEMPVAAVSLNELSRRAGLAKSNVLLYFESREAILLELLDAEVAGWLAALEGEGAPPGGTPRERGDRLAATLAASLAARPVLCDLIAAQAAVLERNISAEVALRHKRATLGVAGTLTRIIRRAVPEVGEREALELVAITILVVAAAWPSCRPTEAVRAAFAADPALADLHTDFATIVCRAVELTISGLLARLAQGA